MLRDPSALPIAALAALAVALPALALGEDLALRYLGHPTPDLFDHIYLYEWWSQLLCRGQLPSTHTELISGPAGGRLVMPDPLGASLYALLRLGLGPVLSFNLATLAGLSAGGAAAAWMARRLGAGAGGALLSGVLYGGSAYGWAQLANGESETLRMAWLPLSLYALLLARRSILEGGLKARDLGRCAAAGALLGLTFTACWYYGAYALMMAAALLSLEVLPRLLHSRLHLARGLGGMALLFVVAGVIIIPQAALLDEALGASDSLFRMPDVRTVLATDSLALGASSADLRSVVSPGALSAQGGYLHGGYLGAFPLLAAVAGLTVCPSLLPWAALGLGAFVLSLGPRLFVGGEALSLGGGAVELPYLWLADVLPWFGAMRLPYRWLVVAHLALALVAGVGLSRGWRRLKPHPALGLALGALLSLGAWADMALYSGLPSSPATLGVPASPVPRELLAQGGGVLDLPMRFGRQDARGIYLVQGLETGMALPPIEGRHSSWTPYSLMSTQLSPPLATNPLLVEVARRDPYFIREAASSRPGTALFAFLGRVERAVLEEALRPAPSELAQGQKALADLGLRHIALRRQALSTGALLETEAFLRRHLGPPVHQTREVSVYALKP